MRIGLVGAGRRMLGIYVPLLQKLETHFAVSDEQLRVVGFTTRSVDRRLSFAGATGLKAFVSPEELIDNGVDVLLVCVAADATASVLRDLFRFKVPLLVETPISDLALAGEARAVGARVGVMEQWPFLPLEQVKELIYQRGLIQRPMLVVNDCRSLDYHAMAQLRTYLGRDRQPKHVSGVGLSFPLVDHLTHAGGKATSVTDAWDIATVQFDNGAVLQHTFAYACKTAPFRSMQTLRAFSTDGTLISGRLRNPGDDYEIIDFRVVGPGGTSAPLSSSVFQPKWDRAPSAIELRGTVDGQKFDVDWSNPFRQLSMNDTEVAVGMHILRMHTVVHSGGQLLYDIRDATMDQLLVYAIKQSIARREPLKIT